MSFLSPSARFSFNAVSARCTFGELASSRVDSVFCLFDYMKAGPGIEMSLTEAITIPPLPLPLLLNSRERFFLIRKDSRLSILQCNLTVIPSLCIGKRCLSASSMSQHLIFAQRVSNSSFLRLGPRFFYLLQSSEINYCVLGEICIPAALK